MFADIFERHENEVKECGLKTVNDVRASNFLAVRPRISSYASVWIRFPRRIRPKDLLVFLSFPV